MITEIQGLPSNMVGFRASGEVTADDFVKVKSRVAEIVEKTGVLNYLLVLDNTPADFTAGAWLQDAILGLKNLTKWHRAAIVSDQETVRIFTDLFSKIMPGEFKGFTKPDLQEAIIWTAGLKEQIPNNLSNN